MDILWKESDTRMLARYSLVPVTTILATVNWANPLFFEELRRRAPWRQGGTDEIVKKIEAQEEKEKIDKQLVIDDTNTQLAKDAWGMYLKKIGLRSQMWSPKTKASQPAKKVTLLHHP